MAAWFSLDAAVQIQITQCVFQITQCLSSGIWQLPIRIERTSYTRSFVEISLGGCTAACNVIWAGFMFHIGWFFVLATTTRNLFSDYISEYLNWNLGAIPLLSNCSLSWVVHRIWVILSKKKIAKHAWYRSNPLDNPSARWKLRA